MRVTEYFFPIFSSPPPLRKYIFCDSELRAKEAAMEFSTVIRSRRSVRSYSPEPIPDDVLERIMDAARIAPSANNVQPWRYIVVTDATRVQKAAAAADSQQFIAEAPVVIVLCAERYTDRYSWLGENMYLVDAAISMDHLILAARNEGVGSCWIGAFDKEAIRELFKIPDGIEPILLTPLGYPKTPSTFSDICYRKSFDDILYSEIYGNR
jgi:nitroreductase